jgi:hypothetical protein
MHILHYRLASNLLGILSYRDKSTLPLISTSIVSQQVHSLFEQLDYKLVKTSKLL